MSTIIDKPSVSVLENPTTEVQDLLRNMDGFPDSLILISLGNGKFAGIDATTPETPGSTAMNVKLIAVFATEDEVKKWENVWHLTGQNVTKTIDEACDIAISKEGVYGLGLQVDANTAQIRWVR